MSNRKKSWLAALRNIVSLPPRLERIRRARPEVELLEDRRLLAVLKVTVAGDNGNDAAPLAGSLRAAIINAKAGDTVVFAIGNAPQTILVKTTLLPVITKPIIIDGLPTAGNPAQTIELKADPASVPIASNGLDFQPGADGSKVFGLTIDGFGSDGILLDNVASMQVGAADGTTVATADGNITVANGQGRMFIYGNGSKSIFGDGIEITGKLAKGNTVVASFIGTNAAQATGKSPLQLKGISIHDGASGNYIGPGSLSTGTVAAGANVISGNDGFGISIAANGNFVAGNYIGTKEDGKTVLPNDLSGVSINGNDNVIGAAVPFVKGTIATPANIITGNKSEGIFLHDSTGTKVWGNFVGVDKTGTASPGNSLSGILLMGSATGTFIGGAQPGLGNVIAGNGTTTTGGAFKDGISFYKDGNNDPQNVTVQHNWIGFGNDGKTKLPNGGDGVSFTAGGSNNLVKDNTIYAKPGTKNINDPNKKNKTFDPNSIFNDTSGGIEDNSNPADTGDSAPVLTSAVVSGTTTAVQGSLASTPNATFVLEFFGNSAASPTGYGPGEFFLGNTTVTTNDQGNASFSVTLNAVYGSYVSATATGTADNGYTSEFSRDIALSGAASSAAVGGSVWNDTNDNGLQNSGEAGVSGVWVSLVPNAGGTTLTTTTDSTGHYLFSGVAPGDYYLQFTSPTGDAFTQPYQGNGMNDSHASPLDGTTEVFTLTAGEYDPYLSAGVLALTSGPSVNILPAGPVNAGDNLVTEGWFAEPGGSPWTATVDYGDGSGAQSLSLNPDNTFDLSHAYITSGNYTVTVNVTDNNGVVGSTTLPVQVLLAAPVVTLGNDTAIQTGVTFTQAGSFSDPYSTSWTATVDYGDGGGAQTLTLNSDHTFSLSHAYGTAGTYQVLVTVTSNTGAVGYGGQYVGVFAPVVVSSVSPAAGPTSGGTSVTVSGSGFTGATAVYFGSTAATSITVNSDGSITAVSPAGSAGTVDVTVTNPVGTSATVSGDHFTYVVAPMVMGLSPSSGPTSGGTTVTISGSGFTGATAVYFGNTAAASFTVNSDSSITAVSPAGPAGTTDVSVVTPGGTSPGSSAERFTYVAPPPPAIMGLSVSSGPGSGGTTVTIYGSGFTGATTVYFGTTAVTSFTVNSDGSITVVSPPGVGTVDIAIVTPAGRSATEPWDQFTYT